MNHICNATLNDLDAIHQIETACQDHPWTKEQIESAINSNQTLWTIKYGEQVAGFLLWQALVDEAEIYNLAVDPKVQRQGLASELIQKLIQTCQQQGILKIFLEVRASNQKAQNLYSKHQFEKIAERKDYYRTTNGKENAWVMEYTC